MPTADFCEYLFQYVNELRSVTDALPRKPRKDEGSYVLSLRLNVGLIAVPIWYVANTYIGCYT